MIPSRDIGDVANELKKFNNLKKITRDGSVIYKNAIELANPKIVQISDRFHILKSLSESISNELRAILPYNITIDKINENIKMKTLKERFYNAKKDINNGATLKNACSNNNIHYKTMKKLMEMNEYEIVSYFEDEKMTQRMERIEEKNKLVDEVKQMRNKGMSYTKISKLLNISRKTAKKYATYGFVFKIENTSRHRTNSCEKYHTEIQNMIDSHYTIKEIYEHIVTKGDEGKYGSVKRTVAQMKKTGQFKNKVVLPRKHVIKLLYKQLNKIAELSKGKLRKIYQLYPKVKMILELFYEFRSILHSMKSVNALESWIKKAGTDNFSHINSFITGIKKDFDAVKNSILYQESNGVVEASVNKLKLVKRIMYGRCSFELLKSKTLMMSIIK